MAVRVSTGFASAILGPQSFAQIFQDGCIELREGPQPASADDAATGVLLARITRDALAWSPGAPQGGLRYVQAGRFASKDPAHVWRLTGLATGTVGWCRVVGNTPDAGDNSPLYARIDGAVALLPADGEPLIGDSQMQLPTLAITPATSIPITRWLYAIPPLGA